MLLSRVAALLAISALAFACSSGPGFVNLSGTTSGGDSSGGASASSGASTPSASGSTSSGASSGAGGASTSSGGVMPDASCVGFASFIVSCADQCTYVNPSQAKTELAYACERGYAGFKAQDRATLESCVDCWVQGALKFCVPLGDIVFEAHCGAPCEDQAVQDKGNEWMKALLAAGDPAVACTSGEHVFQSQCTQSMNGMACERQCCNGPCGPNPTVAVACAGPGPVDCACTAGANKGKSFQLPGCDYLGGTSVWTECNL